MARPARSSQVPLQMKKGAVSRAFLADLPAAQFPVALATSIETPGPMVDEMETFFM